jgi:ribosomal protein S27E
VAWASFRRRRRLAWLGFLGWFPLGGLTFAISGWLFGPGAGVYPAVPLLVWMAWMVIASNAFMNTRCPRCAKPLLRTWWYHNAFSRKCLHCGLAIGTPKGNG